MQRCSGTEKGERRRDDREEAVQTTEGRLHSRAGDEAETLMQASEG